MERGKNCMLHDWKSTVGGEASQCHALQGAAAQVVTNVVRHYDA